MWDYPAHSAREMWENRAMDDLATIGARLRLLRKARGMRIADAAAAIGDCSRAHLNKVELGQDPSGGGLLRRAADFYGVTVDYLQTGATARGAKVGDESPEGRVGAGWIALGEELTSGERDELIRFARATILPRRGGGRNRRA